MVQLKSTSNVVGFPVSACQWLSNDQVILAGGGGASKSGVKNSLKVYKVNLDDLTIELESEADLVAGEDAPTSFCYNAERQALACGINGTLDAVKEGTSESLKIFELEKKEIVLKKSLRVLKNKSPFDYQKVTVFNQQGSILLMAFAEGQITVLNYPSLEPRFTSKKCENEDINSGDIDDGCQYIATTSDKAVHFWDADDGKLIQTIEAHRNGIKNKPCNFRSIQFGKADDNKHQFYLAINAADRKRSYISKFSLKDFKLILTRSVAFNPILSFCINNSGTLLAVGCSDLGIRLCCPNTLRTLATLKSAHGFPVTTLSFSLDDTHLLSGSADGSCRVIKIPKEFGSPLKNLAITFIVLLVLFTAVLYYALNNGLIDLPADFPSLPPFAKSIIKDNLPPTIKDEL